MWEACELCSQHRCFWRAWNQIPQRNVIQSNNGPFRKSSQEPFDNVAKKLTCVQRKRSWEKARLTMAATKHFFSFFRDRKTMMLAKMFSLPLTDACWASQNDFLSSIVQTQISREMLFKELFILLLLLLRAPLWKRFSFIQRTLFNYTTAIYDAMRLNFSFHLPAEYQRATTSGREKIEPDKNSYCSRKKAFHHYSYSFKDKRQIITDVRRGNFLEHYDKSSLCK